MTTGQDRHMSLADFRRHGHAVVDWVADYIEGIESRPVMSQVKPGDVRSRLPPAPPATGEPFEAMLRDVDDIIMPGITHWQSPSFFGFFPANSSGPAILGELLSAGLGVQGMLWLTSPACTELETHVLDWLVGMLDLPDRFLSSGAGGGVIQDTASSAMLCALLAARERATDFRTSARGVDRPLIAYTSQHAHSAAEKAMVIAGLGRENLRWIETDTACAMRPDALAAAIAADRAAGRTPIYVCATVGTTSSNGMDPLGPIGEICRRENLWFHVDAAMSGTAALCPEHRWIHDGIGDADSYCFNPHKWMLTNFDCDCFWVADRAALIRTLTVLPEYLRNAATSSGAVFDYRDWQVPLGRRFRALKLWFVIRHYGVEGLREHVRHHVELARALADWIRNDDDFELVVEPPLTLICFRHRGGDAVSEAIVQAVNASGDLFLSHTRLDGKYVIRLAIGQTHTEHRHVEAAWAAIRAAAKRVTAAMPPA